jgi:hypothetical protein
MTHQSSLDHVSYSSEAMDIMNEGVSTMSAQIPEARLLW